MKLNQFRRILRENVHLPEPGDADFLARAKETVPFPVAVSRDRRRFSSRFATLSAAFALVCTAFVFLVLGTRTSSTVSLDINPSVNLELNRFGRVIRVDPENADGEILVSALDRTRGSLEDVLDGILETASSLGYVASADSADLLFGISGSSYESEQSLEAEILSFLPEGEGETLFLNLHSDSESLLREGLLTSTQTGVLEWFGFTMNDSGILTTTAVYTPSDLYETTSFAWYTDAEGKYVVPSMDGEIGEANDASSVSKTLYSDLSPEEFAALAESFGVSETKLNLALLVFNGYPTYILPSDLAYLCSRSVGELIALYEALG